jgi:SRSO17 transposase
VTLASGEVPLMLSMRLFLPESWTSDEARMIKAGVPEQFRQSRTKPELAIEEIDRVVAAGVRFGCVLADAGYGLSASFRQALSARGLCWAVGIPKHQKVYPVDVQLISPEAARGRPRLRHMPDVKSLAAQAMLEGAKWRQVSWRRGTKGRLVARFAALRVRIADGAPQRIGSTGAQHMPGEEAWLVGEHRSNGEQKYYLSNLPADTPIKEVAGAIKARWICEQAHRQLKEELGLDHFEGRSWTGLHRHALMTMMAYAFLQNRRLTQAGRKKRVLGPPPQPSLPAVRQAILDRLSRSLPPNWPRCGCALQSPKIKLLPK